jgi:hypothetical protein
VRTKKVTVHYCDHCSGRKFTVPAMVKHELACTMNPNRVCRMCKMAGLTQKPLSELMAAAPVFELDREKQDDGSALRKAAGNCPACILAAIRQSNEAGYMEFNWKEESRVWVKRHFRDPNESPYGH